MAEQPPHVEVFSRNKVSRSRISFIAVAIPITALSGLAVYALLPFILAIGYGLLALAAVGFVYLVAVAAIDVRRRWLHAHVFHLGEHGALDAANWRMLPLALPPPVITEVPSLPAEKPKDMDPDHWRILELWGKGMDLRSIATACNTTFYQAQKITSDWKKKLENSGYTSDS